MAVDFKTFLKVVPHVTAIKKPVLIRGKHGIGKSELVYAFAAALGKRVVERRASQMTEGDLIGLPSINGNRTKWNPPDWFKDSCEDGVVLFLDEVDRATTEVRQGIFELTDSRKLNGHYLHNDTLIFAAVNGGNHGSQYQVGEMDPAELDRWTVFDVEPTVEDWLDFAKGKVNGIVWDFVNQNRVHLEHKGEYEPNKVYPSRRSWFRFNDCLTNANLLGEDVKKNLPMIYELGCAFVGMEASVAIRDFAEKYEKQVTVDDILAGKLDKVKDWNINDHVAMIDKIIASDKFKEKATDKTIKALAAYGMKMPAEATMKLWKLLGSQNVQNAVEFHKIAGNHIISIMTGGANQKK
jgi:hypothetical protein